MVSIKITYFPLSLAVNSRGASSVVMLYLPRNVNNNDKINIHYSRRKTTAKVFTGDASTRWGRGGVAVSALDFRSEGQWFEAQSLVLAIVLFP